MSDLKFSPSEEKLYNQIHALRLMEVSGGRITVKFVRKLFGFITLDNKSYKDEKLAEYLRENFSDTNCPFELAKMDEEVGLFVKRTEEVYKSSSFGYDLYNSEVNRLKNVRVEIATEMKDSKKEDFKSKVKSIVKKNGYGGMQDYMIRMAILHGKFDDKYFGIFGNTAQVALVLGNFVSDRKDAVGGRMDREINYDYFEDEGWDLFEVFIFLDIVTDGVLDFNFVQDEYGDAMFVPEPEPMPEPVEEPGVIVAEEQVIGVDSAVSESDGYGVSEDSGAGYGVDDDSYKSSSSYGDDGGGYDSSDSFDSDGDCGGGDW